jgi:TM2 domain-containing membrane protein YozV
MNFFLSQNGQRLGPYSFEQLRMLHSQGLAQSTDLVWTDGWAEWLPLDKIPGVAQGSVLPPPNNKWRWTPGPGPQSFASAKNPIIACVLSIFIPGTGQLYNEDWGKGWGLLVTCVLSAYFSCGTSLIVWSIFSAVDAYRVASRQKPLGTMFPL